MASATGKPHEAASSTFYSTLWSAIDGQVLALGVFGSAAAAREHSDKVARRTFVPHDDDRRFRVVPIENIVAVSRRKSLVATPADPQVAVEMFFEDGDLFDRESGLLEVARLNREAEGGNWHVLIELGRKLPVPSGTIEIFENGVGAEERRFVYPVRVVLATEAERIRHRI